MNNGNKNVNNNDNNSLRRQSSSIRGVDSILNASRAIANGAAGGDGEPNLPLSKPEQRRRLLDILERALEIIEDDDFSS